MTREEAINKYIIPTIKNTWNEKKCNEILEALEHEPCEDCISRQAVEKITWEEPSYTDALNVLTEVRDKVRALPSVIPQPKTGHWSRKIKVDAYDIAGVKSWGIKCQCDRCGFITIVIEDFGYYKYCPNCGAKMGVKE